MSDDEEATETIDGVVVSQEDSDGHREENPEMVAVNLLQNVESLQ